MHIAFLTPEYPCKTATRCAGIGTSTKNLAVALIKKGIRVTVFVYSQKTEEVFNSEGVDIFFIKHIKYSLLGWYLYRKHIQNFLCAIIAKNKIDILEAPDWTGITAFMKFKIPLVIRFHGSDAYFCKLENRNQKLKNFWFEKIALKNASGYIAPTTYAGKETNKIFNLDNEKIKTIYHGVELDCFSVNNAEDYQKNTLLYIGTIIRKKGVLQLAEIFNKVVKAKPEAKLILIGGDAYDIKTNSASTYKLMENVFSKKAKQQVNYLGKRPYCEVMKYIKKAHVCAFPSFAETLGMVTIESMALHKPVVNTSIGWAQELINDGVDGYLIDPTEIDNYASKIVSLFSDEALCSKIGRAARQKIESKFDIEKNVELNVNYYKTFL